MENYVVVHKYGNVFQKICFYGNQKCFIWTLMDFEQLKASLNKVYISPQTKRGNATCSSGDVCQVSQCYPNPDYMFVMETGNYVIN